MRARSILLVAVMALAGRRPCAERLAATRKAMEFPVSAAGSIKT